MIKNFVKKWWVWGDNHWLGMGIIGLAGLNTNFLTKGGN